MPAAAYLFVGSAMYFDDDGEQIVEMQLNGLCGLHAFVEKYPKAPVYWGWFRKWAEEISPESLPHLLCCLKKKRSKVK